MNTLRTSSLVTALNSNSLSVVCDGQLILTGIERFDKLCDRASLQNHELPSLPQI